MSNSFLLDSIVSLVFSKLMLVIAPVIFLLAVFIFADKIIQLIQSSFISKG
ncbi:hypothetical protein PDQ74_28610 [Bacillus cereus group sp. Bc005]|uniref:hypothetical protein n=1 Tax=Bacillus cereus group TaxID=86661 RepID=UPI0021573024|nr:MULTISPECIES: hypothetical protein [Bacillus cereus group]MCR6795749.1 hypothetical protein [Bacillus paranthracis]MDA2202896.1 hypothetical protein [Bacillus cereus group sp. Bc237]MDA2760849.1 hypothetical protein [Bacillus cereus group sp. Bc007]MDA2766536.1 hypothetical protein [Bacillus cereus group sp. Bc008]MDA2777651.1 hypothetical protein [Bacillus cereus group sp. Bc005]